MQDDDEVEEIIQDDEEDEDDIDEADGDDDDDDEYSGDVSFNMTGKEDPDFSPGIDSLKKIAASPPVRRSSRWVHTSQIPSSSTVTFLYTSVVIIDLRQQEQWWQWGCQNP